MVYFHIFFWISFLLCPLKFKEICFCDSHNKIFRMIPQIEIILLNIYTWYIKLEKNLFVPHVSIFLRICKSSDFLHNFPINFQWIPKFPDYMKSLGPLVLEIREGNCLFFHIFQSIILTVPFKIIKRYIFVIPITRASKWYPTRRIKLKKKTVQYPIWSSVNFSMHNSKKC